MKVSLHAAEEVVEVLLDRDELRALLVDQMFSEQVGPGPWLIVVRMVSDDES